MFIDGLRRPGGGSNLLQGRAYKIQFNLAAEVALRSILHRVYYYEARLILNPEVTGEGWGPGKIDKVLLAVGQRRRK